jgi:uncharacterized protein (TIGR04222 family)
MTQGFSLEPRFQFGDHRMDQLLNNAVTTMWGPAFLGFYATLWGIAFVWFWLRKRNIDSSRDLPSLPVPEAVDPYQLAYLRGGLPELLRLGTVELFSRGVMIEEKKWTKVLWMVDESKLRPGVLTPLAREVAHFFREPRKPADIFRDSADRSFVANSLLQFTDPWDEWIESEKLQLDPQRRSLFTIQVVLAAIGLLALGLLKISSAVLREHYNIGFLVIMMVAAAIASFIVGAVPKFSDRGRRFVKDIELAYNKYRKVDKKYIPGTGEHAPSYGGLGYDLPVMAAGLYGIAALQGSSLGSVHRQLEKSKSASSSCGGASSCGGGCSSGSAGSGCGGGCGGGGCGGCGS